MDKINANQSGKWSDRTILESLSNPTTEGYEVKIDCPEVTFLGIKDQPDFAKAYITIYPKEKVIELRSLKRYFQQFRDKVISYERLINVVYDDLMEMYKPDRLRITMIFNPRGGITSRLTIDSDWSIRGGKEKYKDWIMSEEEW